MSNFELPRGRSNCLLENTDLLYFKPEVASIYFSISITITLEIPEFDKHDIMGHKISFSNRRTLGIFHNVFNKCIALDQSHSSICSTVKNCNPEGNPVKYKVEIEV